MKKETVFNINGQDYNAIIEYRFVKYVRVSFENGCFKCISNRFVSLDFIKDCCEKVLKRKKKVFEEALTSSYAYIYGNKVDVIDNFLIYDDLKFIYSKEKFYEDIKKYFYKYIDQRISYFENLMGISEHYKLTIRFTKTIYGSNSSKSHHITINSYLIHFKKEIIDAIIVHELAHHFIKNHSKNFYNIVYKYCPNYRYLHMLLANKKYGG